MSRPQPSRYSVFAVKLRAGHARPLLRHIHFERNHFMKELILAYQGEMTLKGLNRGKFEARLAKTIRWRLEPLGKFKVYQAQRTVSSSRRRPASTWTRRSAACPMCSAS